jgi:hypothetical protein
VINHYFIACEADTKAAVGATMGFLKITQKLGNRAFIFWQMCGMIILQWR